MSIIKFIGIIILLTALILAGVWYGWKLPVVLFLTVVGNNFEQFKNK